MPIHDGYGEFHSEYVDVDELEKTIRTKERLLQIQVSERSRNASLRDDLLQEARITIWRVLEKKPDAIPAYLHASTAHRISELLSRDQKWFGQDTHHGQAVDPLRREQRDSFDDPDFLIEATSPDVMDDLLLAYHEGEILQAIRSLAPNHQAYVILRFWGGWTAGEIAPVIGVKSTNQARMWTNSIRPVLADHLKHLVDA